MRESIIVFNHELRYFLTLKQMKRSIFIQCLAPAIFVLLNAYFYKTIDLRIAVIIMIIGIPRIPMSLTGYSIAGEKVYHTFESILSTPISIKSLFIGKSILPIGISLIMFIFSSLITLITTNLYAKYTFVKYTFTLFNLTELLIIFGNGLLIVTFIIFITGLTTLLMKVPRNGLFITSMLTFLFGIPYSLILYGKVNDFLLSIITLILLLLINIFCYLYLLKKMDINTLFLKAI